MRKTTAAPPGRPSNRRTDSGVQVRLKRAIARQRWWLEAWETELYKLDDAPVSRQRGFLSWRAMNVAVRPHLHDPKWESLLSNKWIFALYYSKLNAPIPATYGLLHPVHGVTLSGQSMRGKADFLQWLDDVRPPALALKPLGGNQGKGVQLIREIRWNGPTPTVLMVGNRLLDLDDLYESVAAQSFRGLEGHLLQEWLQPHPDIHRLAGSAPHNIRVVTAVLPSGSVIVQLAAIRLGFGDAQVDSWSSGGIAGPVDPETGRIGIVWTMPEFGGKVMDVHPDTGSRLTGTTVPCWDEVKAAAITMARLTPGLKVVGWDVVISSDGPRIVEGNFDWSLALVQSGTQGVLGGPVAEMWRLLGADLPDGSFSWRWRHRRRPTAAAVRRLLTLLERR